MACLSLLIALGCVVSANAEISYSFSARVYYNNQQTQASYLTKDKQLVSTSRMDSIPGKTGCSIRIQRFGICGDADRSSGSAGFRVTGSGGPAFGFEAGQNSKGLKYKLPAAVRVNGQGARYGGYKTFTTQEQAAHTYAVGAAVKVQSAGTNDPDGIYCYEQNPIDGQRINDNGYSSTFRALVMFTYVCSKPCGKEKWQKKPEDPESCGACTTCEDGEEYATQDCISSTDVQQDRKCARCTSRPSEAHFQTIPCTYRSNSVWAKCKKCKSGEYELIACRADRDTLCLPVAEECNVKWQYEATAPTKSTNRLCLPRAKCQKGQFVFDAGGKSANTVCKWFAEPCIPPVQFETKKATTTSDRQCGATTRCDRDEFESVEPTATSDRACKSLTVCAVGEFETTGPTKTSDRVCGIPSASKCTICPVGWFESAKCDLSLKIEEATKCTKCTKCTKFQLMVAPCTSFSDRKCKDRTDPKLLTDKYTRALKAEMHTADGNMHLRGKQGKSVLVEDLAIMTEGDEKATNVKEELQDLRSTVEELAHEFEKYKEDHKE